MNSSLDQIGRLLIYELRRYPLFAAAVFALITISVVVVGLLWRQVYISSTTIMVEDKNIIQPLMSGAAVATSINDRAKHAQEIVFNRKHAVQLLEHGGWMAKKPNETEQENLYAGIKNRTKIVNVGSSLIKIEYRDSDPKRAYKVTQKLADLFIHESTSTQTQESGGAFEFIENQVQEYHAKVVAAEEALKEFRAKHPTARAMTETQRATRIAALETALERTSLELKEAKIRQASIEKQLAGEVLVVASLTREAQHVQRIAELQAQLDSLRLRFHDTHPDVIRVRYQIEDLRQQAAQEQKKGAETAAALRSGQAPVVDDSVKVNPVYQKLRSDSLEAKTNVDLLTTRLTETQQALNVEKDHDKRGRVPADEILELTRDYEVNRDIYQDLLRRRENARVSMNLDRERQGLTVRVHEPATAPLRPTGLRFAHFLLVGLVLGLAAPPALLIGRQHLDRRLRLPAAIDRTGVPVLTVVPHLFTPLEVVVLKRTYTMAVAMVMLTLGVVVLAGGVKLAGLL